LIQNCLNLIIIDIRKNLFHAWSISKIFEFWGKISLIYYISLTTHHNNICKNSAIREALFFPAFSYFSILIRLNEILHLLHRTFVSNFTVSPLSHSNLTPGTLICLLIFSFFAKFFSFIILVNILQRGLNIIFIKSWFLTS